MVIDDSHGVRPLADRRPDILDAIRREFVSLPRLALTSAQAGRLWALEHDTCRQLLALLEQDGFLHCRHDGRYVLGPAASVALDDWRRVRDVLPAG